jgi:pimeloyl-ACP methyl ester carboxylesterase
MAPRESFEIVAGCKTRIMRAGGGKTMLFLHGAGGARIWLPFMEKLSQRFDLIVPEHPGFGGSDTPEWLDNVGDLAFFYLDLIDQLGLKDINLVGTSMGGWTAAEIAVRSCHDLATLVLSAPAGIHLKGVPKGDTFMWSPEEYTRNLVHDQKLADEMVKRPISEDEQLAINKNRLTMAKLAWQPRLYNPHLRKWLHRINVPTLILWGDDDKVIPPAYGPAYQKLIPDARLEIIKACGHLPQVERADEWTGKIVAFIEEAAA